jgi:hypothetical protein
LWHNTTNNLQQATSVDSKPVLSELPVSFLTDHMMTMNFRRPREAEVMTNFHRPKAVVRVVLARVDRPVCLQARARGALDLVRLLARAREDLALVCLLAREAQALALVCLQAKEREDLALVCLLARVDLVLAKVDLVLLERVDLDLVLAREDLDLVLPERVDLDLARGDLDLDQAREVLVLVLARARARAAPPPRVDLALARARAEREPRSPTVLPAIPGWITDFPPEVVIPAAKLLPANERQSLTCARLRARVALDRYTEKATQPTALETQ